MKERSCRPSPPFRNPNPETRGLRLPTLQISAEAAKLSERLSGARSRDRSKEERHQSPFGFSRNTAQAPRPRRLKPNTPLEPPLPHQIVSQTIKLSRKLHHNQHSCIHLYCCWRTVQPYSSHHGDPRRKVPKTILSTTPGPAPRRLQQLIAALSTALSISTALQAPNRL